MAIEPIPFRRDDIDRHPPGLIGRDIDTILAGFGAPPAPVLSRIADAWADLVGPVAAEHTRPGRIADGRLRVDVDGPAWASQMRWQQGEVLAKIAALIPESTITEISPRVRPNLT